MPSSKEQLTRPPHLNAFRLHSIARTQSPALNRLHSIACTQSPALNRPSPPKKNGRPQDEVSRFNIKYQRRDYDLRSRSIMSEPISNNRMLDGSGTAAVAGFGPPGFSPTL